MKNHLVFLFIVLLLGLSSCGIQKRTMSQEVQADSRTESIDSVQLQKTIDKMIQQSLSDNLKRLTLQNINFEKKIYSPPDSAGKQYILETHEVKISTKTEENRTLAVDTSSKTVEKVDSVGVSASVEDLEMDINTHTVEKDGVPLWQKILMIVGGAAILYIIIRIILRFI